MKSSHARVAANRPRPSGLLTRLLALSLVGTFGCDDVEPASDLCEEAADKMEECFGTSLSHCDDKLAETMYRNLIAGKVEARRRGVLLRFAQTELAGSIERTHRDDDGTRAP